MGMVAIFATWPRPFEQIFFLSSHESSTFGFDGPSGFAADVWKYQSEWSLTKVKQRPWPLVSYVFMYSLSQLIAPTLSS